MKRAVLSLSLGLLVAMPVAAQNLESRNAQGTTTILKSAAGWQVDRGQGPQNLPVPPSVRFHALRSAGTVFVAAGTDFGPKGVSLVLLRGEGKNIEALPAPAIPPGERALAPTPVVGPAGLEAFLWIEGKTEQAGAVKAALWNGSAFTATTTLSPVGPGTQTGLEALRLADGSYLAVWSAFDGEDDEILWSRGSANGWSPPQALTNNKVPDITPILRQNGGGSAALAVWSFYDGNDYRLKSATFTNAKWQDGDVFGGKGASRPFFVELGQTVVAFRQVVPESWRAVELDNQGKKQREASLSAATRRAPKILSVDNEAVTLEWSMTDDGANPVSFVVPWEEKKD